MFKHIRLLIVLTALTSLPLLAGEGRIPIWKTTTITAPGSYIVTRDIGAIPDSNPPRAITVDADDVDIDLNGFALRTGEAVIHAEDVRRLVIRNGKIYSNEDAIKFVNVQQFELRRLAIHGLEDACTVLISGSSDGLIEHSRIRGGGLPAICIEGNGIVIRHSVIKEGEVPLQSCIGCEVSENRAAGIEVDPGSSGTLLLNNTVNGGIVVSGDRNHIEGNLTTGNSSFGLLLEGDDNVYRRNTSRGNSGAGCTSPPGNVDFCDNGTGNSSHGDNYIPGKL